MLERAPDARHLLVAQRLAFLVRARIRHVLRRSLRLASEPAVGQTLPSADAIDRARPRDRQQPAADRAAPYVIPRRLAEHLREHVLYDVLGFGVDLHDPTRQRIDDARVPVVERREPGTVAAGGSRQRVTIAEGNVYQWRW